MLKQVSMVLLVGVIVIGCGGKTPASSGPTGGSGADGEAAAAAVNGCTTYKDLTAVGAYEIKWDENIATSEDRCVKLSVEQPMSWVGNFTTHPMKAAGGATPNPFDLVKDNVSNGGSEQESSAVSFQTPGTYGYICGVHPSMTGAVLVVPAAVQ